MLQEHVRKSKRDVCCQWHNVCETEKRCLMHSTEWCNGRRYHDEVW